MRDYFFKESVALFAKALCVDIKATLTKPDFSEMTREAPEILAKIFVANIYN